MWGRVYRGTELGRGLRRAMEAAREAATQLAQERETSVVSPEDVYLRITGPQAPAGPGQVSEIQAQEVSRLIGDAFGTADWRIPGNLTDLKDAFEWVEAYAASLWGEDAPPLD